MKEVKSFSNENHMLKKLSTLELVDLIQYSSERDYIAENIAVSQISVLVLDAIMQYCSHEVKEKYEKLFPEQVENLRKVCFLRLTDKE